MKKIFTLIAFSMYMVAGFAQNNDGIDPKFAAYMIETERKTVFVQNMTLSDSIAPIFWGIYDQFEAELLLVRESGIANLTKYGTEFETLTDDQADEIMKVSLVNEAKSAKIRKKYYGKMSKAVGGKTATRFMQLDSIVSMVLRLSIYDELPLVGDLD